MALDSPVSTRHESPGFAIISSPPQLILDQYRHREARPKAASKAGSKSVPIPTTARSGFASARIVADEVGIDDDDWHVNEDRRGPKRREARKRKSDPCAKPDAPTLELGSKRQKHTSRNAKKRPNSMEDDCTAFDTNSGRKITKPEARHEMLVTQSLASVLKTTEGSLGAESTSKSVHKQVLSPGCPSLDSPSTLKRRPSFRKPLSLRSSPVKFKTYSQCDDPIVDIEEPVSLSQRLVKYTESTQKSAESTAGNSAPKKDKSRAIVSCLSTSPASPTTVQSPGTVDCNMDVCPHSVPRQSLLPQDGHCSAPRPYSLDESGARGAMLTRQISVKKVGGHSMQALGTKASRTVTNIAIAHYAIPEEDASIGAVDKPFFRPRPYDAKELLAGEVRQSKKKAARAKKLPPPPVKLLSPSQMQRRMRRQDVLFGTSSQLACDDSPSSLRQFQQAMRESEQDIGEHADAAPCRTKSEAFRKTAFGTRSLWDTSRLEGEEDLYQPESQEDVNDYFEDIDELGVESEPDRVAASGIPKNEEKVARLKLSKSSSKPKPTLRIIEASRAPVLNQQQRFYSTNTTAIAPAISVSKKISGTSHEDSTERTTEEKPEPAVKGRGSRTRLEDPAAPQRSRGRPRKTAAGVSQTEVEAGAGGTHVTTEQHGHPKTAAFHCDESALVASNTTIQGEQVDENDPLGAVNARARFNQESQIQKKVDDKARELARRAEHKQRQQEHMHILGPQISLAVLRQSRSPNALAKLDCWYEKILLYEPIVLEHFTQWLNSGPLHKLAGRTIMQDEIMEKELGVGEHGVLSLGARGFLADLSEVEPGCGLTGRLQPWTTQRWCEENSICCVPLEGFWRNALARKRRMGKGADASIDIEVGTDAV